MPATLISDADKTQLWNAYRARRPTRVPMGLYTNARVVINNPAWNPDGVTFEDCFRDPLTHLRVQLQHELFRRTVIGRYSDLPTELPDVWVVGQFEYNVYEAAQLGAPIRFPDGQVPVTEPPYAGDDLKHAIFDADIEHPLQSTYWSSRLAFWREIDALAKDYRFEGRPVRLAPLAQLGTDGPVTVASNLRGGDFLLDLAIDPDYADRLMAFLCAAVVHRRAAFKGLWGDRIQFPAPGIADDSCALISVEMYRRQVMPHHRRLLDQMGEGPRGIHMCGHATHLFPTLRDELDIASFDTGFPVDHGKLRRQLGPDVEIVGGPEVDLLLAGAPDAVYQRTRDILLSGVKAGGRFILREGNNLPPNIPEANLEAMYEACQEHGGHNAL